ncbi:MAG: LysE family translocator [Gammaproteobacteria bacterium]|nr:LysE family translocator [Gammaproteobacteria bacterium]NIR83722.1 LysE family translocator [Gammaproteobacteria bacterium]NIR91869.1 LysE family translocator [Gammaproteobacteria bacterium]NIU04888.1 LysE family translocator [Gammaproteobacteria bacterium]NIV51870.1 LysE family transporter [Gammaproteobacteria bacterium]
MSTEQYLAFVVASAVLIVIPGPNVSVIVANSLRHGARGGLLSVAGTSSAMAVQLAVVCIGITSLMLVLAHSFEWLRWGGVLYLLYLGIQRWREAGRGLDDAPPAAPSPAALYWQGFVVSATNPKTLVFYAAFFPQFVDPHAPATPQLVLLSVTFLGLATVLDGGYALAGGRLRALFRRRSARWCGRANGSLLIGAAIALAAARRSN